MNSALITLLNVLPRALMRRSSASKTTEVEGHWMRFVGSVSTSGWIHGVVGGGATVASGPSEPDAVAAGLGDSVEGTAGEARSCAKASGPSSAIAMTTTMIVKRVPVAIDLPPGRLIRMSVGHVTSTTVARGRSASRASVSR